MKTIYVNAEQRSLLNHRSFSLRPLANAGHLDLWRIFSLTWLPIAIFWFGLLTSVVPLRLKWPNLVMFFQYLGLFGFMLGPTMALGVLVCGVGYSAFTSRVRWAAVTYWVWWPFWRFVFCVLALCLALSVGDGIWNTELLHYDGLARLQKYAHVDPHRVSGARLQDSGLVTFNETAGVDRSRGACFQNGHTFCVAPIVRGGVLAANSSDTPASGGFDFFMIGVDCCTCEPGLSQGSEFRCGDWNSPKGLVAGTRLIDERLRGFYRLAVDDWSATYNKPVKHPLFYHWTRDPIKFWDGLRVSAIFSVISGLLVSLVLFMLGTMVVNGFLNFMVDNHLAHPIDPPVAQSGIGKTIAKKFLPGMVDHQDAMDAREFGSKEPKFVVL